ncbi:16S rRNA (guanine(527)-N(7))-methyltransferase RsmG [Acidomonas methanolica]|uniref:Ribosomal RNA small subunit methyltransferase G n=3 Tax=Acidomonas methanolica TaxID=437 RepID=A0A023D309_ACIMT|nr:16S rRNA (guanine(527)-N(7))-methyltransferase RsmG [Acidomonas methanolica]MBU2654040.1 16S rRNA (guanine(527)-N(7))-methyltransferase RsmG [Acidomonas methanolica]TCS30730.1 16S rRNA m(7)G-527 methyltransferase [Acidomonas methanolica]GAJ28140.1 glucose inhibited division protein B methyltransferase GidB [Acidomonas methanolica NBRC 104435]GEK98883.1 ribosomal RNA small subunit methyltransferase G [Acidomonas methanolica NBRC 104435]
MSGDVSRETFSRLEVFASLLRTWNTRINLVSPRDMEQLWPRHIEDSLQLAPLVPQGARVIDLGSGGGFPGMIVGIAAGAEMVFIESDRRKAAFLREAARACGVRAQVMAQRIEVARPAPAPVVTARALAPLDILLGWAAPLLASGGYALFLKGKSLPDELTEAGARWQMSHESHPSRTDPQGTILKVWDIRPVEEE